MNWKKVKLGEVCEVIAGQSPPSNTYNSNGEGLPFFQGKTDFGIINPKIRMYCNNPVKVAERNDILLSVRAPVGPTNIANQKCCIGRGLAAIRSSGKTHPEYLFYFFKKIEKELSNQGNGSTFSAITTSDVKAIQIPLPTLPTQRAIADRLDRADALRQKDRQLLQAYDDLAQSVFVEMFGEEENFPDRFQQIPLSEMADIVSGVAKNEKSVGDDFIEVPYMRVANVQDGTIDLGEVKTLKVSPRDFQKYQLREGDILLTEGGDADKLGRGAIWHGAISPCIHQNHIFRVRLTTDQIIPKFLSWHISSPYGKRYFLKAAKQTTGIASINLTQLKNFQVYAPPLPLQTRFAALLANIERQKELVRQQQAESEALFGRLLQEAFGNGEWAG